MFFAKPAAAQVNDSKEKQELLYQFSRMERKGMRIPKHFTMDSDLEEMATEFQRLTRDHNVDKSINFQRSVVMTMVSGTEYANKMFNPFNIDLDGWSEQLNESINNFDDVFEELHDKYHGKCKIPPEIKLLMMLGGSAAMFHLMKSAMPGMDDVMRQNPEIMNQVMGAAAKMTGQNIKNSGGGGMMGQLGNMIFKSPPSKPVGRMNGPAVAEMMSGPNATGIETFSATSDDKDDALSLGDFSVASRLTSRKVLHL
jgi:hypothetical protein